MLPTLPTTGIALLHNQHEASWDGRHCVAASILSLPTRGSEFVNNNKFAKAWASHREGGTPFASSIGRYLLMGNSRDDATPMVHFYKRTPRYPYNSIRTDAVVKTNPDTSSTPIGVVNDLAPNRFTKAKTTITAGGTAHLVIQDKQWNPQKPVETPSKPQYHLNDATGAQVKQSYIIFDPRYANQNRTLDGDKLAELAKM